MASTIIKPAHKRRHYRSEAKYYEADSLIIGYKKRSNFYAQEQKKLLAWESQHDVNQDDDELK